MKQGWLLYDEADLAQNRDFASAVEIAAHKRGMSIQVVCTSELELGMHSNGTAWLQKGGKDVDVSYVLSRQRDAFLSSHLECMGIRVFNSAQTCALCNDKRSTYQLLAGLPMPRSRFFGKIAACEPTQDEYPLVVKPACGHGGQKVACVQNPSEWKNAVAQILPNDVVEQSVVEEAGKDLRLYVLFGKIIAGVLRTARVGIISNYKLGGDVSLHSPNAQEKALAMQVIARFEQAKAPLCFAGVDLLYGHDGPMVGEVEDVVGSRMLYKVSSLDIIGLYLDAVRERL